MNAEALLAEILSNPDEDTPRLVYADWLEEHGGPPDLERAQFIRAQCTLSRLCAFDLDRPLECGDVTFAHQLRADLLAPFLAPVLDLKLLPPLPESSTDATEEEETLWPWISFAFRRGFIEGLIVHRDEAALCLVEQAAVLFQRLPLRHLVFRLPYSRRLRPQTLAALVQLPCLARLLTLDLKHQYLGQGARCLLDSPYLDGLQRLWLSDNHVGPPLEAALRLRFGDVLVPHGPLDEEIPF
jgi:uncharacterized protein (TIGR02996 family)